MSTRVLGPHNNDRTILLAWEMCIYFRLCHLALVLPTM